MSRDTRLHALNIALMLASAAAALLVPFETFLLAYALLGPLHYLTEISWLHDRQYFTRSRREWLPLVALSVLVAANQLAQRYACWPYSDAPQLASSNLGGQLLLLAFFGALATRCFANGWLRLAALAAIACGLHLWLRPVADAQGRAQARDSAAIYTLTALLPTLIHVFAFTGLFVLQGALKQRSRIGLLAFAIFLACPLALALLAREQGFAAVSAYGMRAYGSPGSPDGMFGLSQSLLARVFGLQPDVAAAFSPQQAERLAREQWTHFVYFRSEGVLLMRCIAFAYLYHYLNWFSKTELIRWHAVPRARMAALVLVWLASVALYAWDYALGLQWLFLLSIAHVLLEFPLNFASLGGIASELRSIARGGWRGSPSASRAPPP